MQRSTAFYTLAFGLAMATAYAVSQENPGQMGTTPQPSVTTPAKASSQPQKPQPAPQKTPANPSQPQLEPTTPTQPQPHATTPAEIAVEKPESAVGGTGAKSQRTPPLATEANPSVGALSPVQPSADELRQKIEAALRREASLSGATIMLNISDDSIDITGNANSPKERLAARRIVQSFAGNRKVRERITVAGVTRRTEEAPLTGTPQPPNGARGTQAAPADQPPPDQQNLDNRPKTDPKKHGDASDKPHAGIDQ